MINENCDYFEDTNEGEYPLLCKYSGSLYHRDEDMCGRCRIWDAYIPNSSTKLEKDKAKKWQNMPYDEQPPYEEYFKNII